MSDRACTEASPVEKQWGQYTPQQNPKVCGTKLITQMSPLGILPIGSGLFCRLRLRRVSYFKVSTMLLGDANIVTVWTTR